MTVAWFRIRLTRVVADSEGGVEQSSGSALESESPSLGAANEVRAVRRLRVQPVNVIGAKG